MKRQWMIGAVATIAVVLLLHATGYGQAAGDFQTQLRDRFDVVTLQQGVALVPKQTTSVRMIQIVNGAVIVDGETMTGAQLRERLGNDADLVLQVSYLSLDQQRALAPGATAAPAAPAAPAQSTVQRTETRRGDIVRFGDPVTVGRNERVDGDVVVFGDSADIDGEVTGDVTVFGDRLRLGPDAVVGGDVNAIGGNLERDPGARVSGEVNEVGRGRGRFRGNWNFPEMFFGSFGSRVAGVITTIVRLTVLALIAFIVVAFGRSAVERIAARAAAGPLRSGLIGLAAEILFLPVLILTIVVLAVSIVGIPLLLLVPFAILLLMLVGLIGFVALAYQMGGVVAARFGWSAPGPYAAVGIGVLAFGSLTVLGRLVGLVGGVFLGMPLTGIGYFIEYIAWTVGFGAALLYWYETQTRFGARRNGVTPATAPAPPPPNL